MDVLVRGTATGMGYITQPGTWCGGGKAGRLRWTLFQVAIHFGTYTQATFIQICIYYNRILDISDVLTIFV